MACGKKTKHTSRIGCCPLCHELFSSDTAIAKHRTRTDADGRQGCREPEKAGLIAKPSRSAPGETIWSLPSSGNPWAGSDV
mgnify:CR=1 FL=1